MNTRQALTASLSVEPNVLARTIETQRKQLKDHLHIADKARAQEDWDMWATAARNVADLTNALSENLEMQSNMTSLSDLTQFTAGALMEAAIKSYREHGDKTFLPALKKAQAAVKPAKGGARVGR